MNANEYLITFFAGYQEAALFSSCDDHDNPLEKNYSIADFSVETTEKMKSDCRKFVYLGWDILNDLDALQTGRDFWFNRNGHGCGFWDGDYTTIVGEKLDKLSKEFGSSDLYVGDDGLLYI